MAIRSPSRSTARWSRISATRRRPESRREMQPIEKSSWPGWSRPSTSFSLRLREDVDARHRRQVYAVCASQTAMAGHDELVDCCLCLPQPLSRCCVFACRTDKYIGGNAKVLMQTADHIDRQAAFSVHDFRDACACSNQRFEIFPGQAKLLHPELDGFDRVGRIHWIVP